MMPDKAEKRAIFIKTLLNFDQLGAILAAASKKCLLFDKNGQTELSIIHKLNARTTTVHERRN